MSQTNKHNETVLCYLEKENQYLFLERNKKKDDLNEGKYIGVGGHIEDGETKEQALIREIKEETNFDLLDYSFRGTVHFINQNGLENYQETMYVFTSNNFKGEFIPCEEGTFHWVDKQEILSLPLWEGDIYFLEKLTEKEEFSIDLIYENSVFIRCVENKK